jgi:hypothetical protein
LRQCCQTKAYAQEEHKPISDHPGKTSVCTSVHFFAPILKTHCQCLP